MEFAGVPVLVTGATGFVGSAVARALKARGAALTLLVRRGSDRTNLADLDATLAEGDLRDEAAVLRAAQGMRYLFHVAADYRIWAPDPEDIVRNNRAGTFAVMKAAQAAAVERIVYTSSVATLKPNDHGVADETCPATPEQAVGAYKRSKVVAERLVEAMAADGLPVVIVNPSTPIGPRDVKPTPTGRIVVEAANGKMPAFVESGLNLVHVDDVAQGHLLALEKGRIGERYVLGGQDVTLRTMLAEIARITGRKAPTISIPRAPLFPLAYANEAWCRLTGKTDPFLTVDSLKMAAHNMYYASTKAENELGYSARPYQRALADAIDWFSAAGKIA
ncbi:hopanoid-associated sugar epimerase [Sphingomonas sp. 28-63-12]|uniref:hopanoid-associated sugar epimerase n=1 Tax=Sphingomonas sp. 28-63-12 TaxID=1970434 RepID=UPI000BD9644E|nr:MAG: NAD-dependent dehydratase [Sphingomonas sp. 28-63-12]